MAENEMNTEKIATRSNKPTVGNQYICTNCETQVIKPFILIII